MKHRFLLVNDTEGIKSACLVLRLMKFSTGLFYFSWYHHFVSICNRNVYVSSINLYVNRIAGYMLSCWCEIASPCSSNLSLHQLLCHMWRQSPAIYNHTIQILQLNLPKCLWKSDAQNSMHAVKRTKEGKTELDFSSKNNILQKKFREQFWPVLLESISMFIAPISL